MWHLTYPPPSSSSRVGVNTSHQLYAQNRMSGMNHFLERRRKDIPFAFYRKKLESREVSSSGEGRTAGLGGGPAPLPTPVLGDRYVPRQHQQKWLVCPLHSSRAQSRSLTHTEYLPGSGLLSPLGSGGCPPHPQCLIKMKMKRSL